MSSSPPGLILRPFAPSDDTAFVIKSWLDSYRESNWGRKLGQLYYPTHRLIVEAILRRSGVEVCCAEQDVDTIAGWACVENMSMLHFVYVKPAFRGVGVARYLLRYNGAYPLTCSHDPSVSSAERLFVDMSYNPLKMFWKPERET